jgi:hypothetical protein
MPATLYPQKDVPVLIYVRLVSPWVIVWLEGLGKLKKIRLPHEDFNP